MRRLVIALVGCALPALAHAGSGALIPPSRVDVSPVTMMKGGAVTTGFHLTAGLHWASLSPSRSNPIDIGIGYLTEQFPANGSRMPPSAECWGDPEHSPWALHGAYLELAHRLSGGRSNRTWLGVRGELLYATVNGEPRSGAGLSGRLAWEMFAPVKGGGSNAAIIGTFGLGVFAEVGHRRLPSGILATSTTAGISLRVPFLIAGS